MVRPMVHSIKHYVQVSIQTASTNIVKNNSIVNAVARDANDQVFEVDEGCSIKAVYVEMWIRASGAAGTSGQMIIYKRSADTSNPSITDMAALGDWDNKKNILYTTQGLFPDKLTIPMVLFKGWIRIPKSKQRFGLGDSLQMATFCPTDDCHMCGFFTYKEYT